MYVWYDPWVAPDPMMPVYFRENTDWIIARKIPCFSGIQMSSGSISQLHMCMGSKRKKSMAGDSHTLLFACFPENVCYQSMI